MQTIEFHELANEDPLLPPAELAVIQADMKSRGYDERFPIVLFEKKILDGRNRYRAARFAGVLPTYAIFDGTVEEAAAFVERANDHRRHLSQQAREAKAAKRRERVVVARAEGKSTHAIAAAEGVSQSTVMNDLKASAEICESAEQGCSADVMPTHVVGRDGKRQPAKRSPKASEPTPKVAPPPPEPEPDEAPWVDGWGIPITAAAAEAFRAQEKFDALLADLKKVRAAYKALAASPGGAFLTRPGVSMNKSNEWVHSGLETCVLNLKDCRPKYTVCPYAYSTNKGYVHDAKCNLCHGLGWTASISKTAAVPQELVAAACVANGVVPLPF